MQLFWINNLSKYPFEYLDKIYTKKYPFYPNAQKNNFALFMANILLKNQLSFFKMSVERQFPGVKTVGLSQTSSTYWEE